MTDHKFDKHPQFLRFHLIESNANTFTEGNKDTPVQQGFTKGKMMVMEILRIFVEIEQGGMVANDEVLFAIYDRTLLAMPVISDPGVLIADRSLTVLTTSGSVIDWRTKVYDFHDGAGNGPLFAGNRMYFAVQGVSQSAESDLDVMIEYRLVEVDAEEFIGIISG